MILLSIRKLARAIRSKSINLQNKTFLRFINFVSTFLSAWCAFQVLNSRKSSTSGILTKSTSSNDEAKVSGKPLPETPRAEQAIEDVRVKSDPVLAGRSMDLTLFAFTRACDVVVGSLWRSWSLSRKRANKFTGIEQMIGYMTDASVFAVSSSVIMWAWFYLPERLPRTYNHWISEAAQIDSRLIEALRLARQGKFIYGRDTGVGGLLSGLCEDLGLPPTWGDPSKTIPIPCHLVHLHSGPNCEYHALSRFFRAFRFALATYLPLQLALRLRSRSSESTPTRLLSILTSSARSSAFLSLFITLFYYSVCLSRTRLGPHLFSYKTISPQMWDSGLCVAAGCMTCGWSILLFVAPRALATILPRRYEKSQMWREGLAFAVSTAVVVTAVKEKRDAVRGVLGTVLDGVLRM